jgi:hypothetical protein
MPLEEERVSKKHLKKLIKKELEEYGVITKFELEFITVMYYTNVSHLILNMIKN